MGSSTICCVSESKWPDTGTGASPVATLPKVTPAMAVPLLLASMVVVPGLKVSLMVSDTLRTPDWILPLMSRYLAVMLMLPWARICEVEPLRKPDSVPTVILWSASGTTEVL